MQPDRIAELLEPFLGGTSDCLTEEDLARISTYIDVLLRWNARINLTAIRTEEEIVTRHFGESFFAARQLFPRETGRTADARAKFRVADVGSGAGFPGIPIKLWAPDVHVTLIESSHKKAAFLREIIRALGLTDINIEAVRAESLAGQRFDAVTLRAVERFDCILPVAAKLVGPTGRLVIMIGTAQLPQAQSTLPALRWSEPQPIPGSRNTAVAIGHP